MANEDYQTILRANKKHLKLLLRGAEVWNRWREENPTIEPVLTRADIADATLGYVDLSKAYLQNVNFRGVYLYEADFHEATLGEATLFGAVLFGANLSRATLDEATLSEATLAGADLSKAIIARANLNEANLNGANLTQAVVGGTSFGNVDLSTVTGLETVQHVGPSTVGIDTIYKSHGNIPASFLRGAGVPDTFIEFAQTLAHAEQPIDYYSCFISYANDDEALAQRLYNDLQAAGVRCWFAPHDMPIGAPIDSTIDHSIRMHEKVLLILSEHSVASPWVKREVRMALAQERVSDADVLFPIRVDNSVMEIGEDWPARIRETRHIGDFTQWKDHDVYQQAFERLLRDLKAEE